MPMALYEKVTIYIDTRKLSREDTKAKKPNNNKALFANIKTRANKETTTVHKYSRKVNNRNRNG